MSAAPPPREEVVIDDDEDEDDDDEVVVVPAVSRGRRRSAILDEDDEQLVQARQALSSRGPHAGPANAASLALAAPISTIDMLTPPPISRRHSQDDVVHIGSSSGKKRKRMAVLDSDDEPSEGDAQAYEPEPRQSREMPAMTRRHSLPATNASSRLLEDLSGDTDGERDRHRQSPSSSLSVRRSSRIHHKRVEKQRLGPVTKKLEFRSLDNCLDDISTRRQNVSAAQSEEEEQGYDSSETEDEEPEELPARMAGRRVTTAGDEMDDFIAAEDEVEYMDDNEEGVISVDSDDEVDEEAMQASMRSQLQTREPSEWLEIYLQYLEACLYDGDLELKIRRDQNNPDFQVFQQAVRHVENKLTSRRDSLRTAVAWPDELVQALNCATRLNVSSIDGEFDCDACRRANHYAAREIRLGGLSCDGQELYRDNWVKKLRRSVAQNDSILVSFQLGTVCFSRAYAYWQLQHAKHFWCALVDATMHDGISEEDRQAFYKKEFGRFKRLMNLVEPFSQEQKNASTYVPNVWKKVTAHEVDSSLLSGERSSRQRHAHSSHRRGTLDSFVGESDDDDDEEMESDELEEEEEEKAQISNVEAHAQAHTPPYQTTDQSRPVQSESATASAPNASMKSDTSDTSEKDVDGLKCLVCNRNDRNGAIIHGYYMHLYACYGCAKRQFAGKIGCMVCDRPITQVVHVLPLTAQARESILKEQQQ